MIDGGPFSEVPEDSSQHEELPERLRVHSLARALGTTSRQVLDALTELDGRIRSAHSTVERVDAVRVRDLLASAPATVSTTAVATEASAAGDADEPESRTMLETTTVERPEYMPLFVAPQPVERRKDSAVAEDPADSDDDDDFDGDSDADGDDDDEQADRPANRRRRRGRRGRGRGRGEQNGADGGENGAKSDAASGDDADDDDDPMTTRTTPMPTTTAPATAPPSVADAVVAASPAPATTPRTARHRTTRRTPWCTSGRPAPRTSPRPATTRFRASTARPGWRPNGSVVVMVATPDAAARRS